MKITITIVDICLDSDGNIGHTKHHEVNFDKRVFPRAAARKAKEELVKLGLSNVNVYDKKTRQYGLDVVIATDYLRSNNICFDKLLEPTVIVSRTC